MKKILLLLFLGSYVAADAQTVQKIRINPDNALGGTVSQLFDSVAYIPLETTKESTFGGIEKLQVSTHYFAFFDYDTKGIFVFDKKGKFVSKITAAPGLDPANYYYLSGFVLNPYTENIYLSYYATTLKSKVKNGDRVAVFQPNGKLKKVIILDSTLTKNISMSQFAFLDSNTTIHSMSFKDSMHDNYLAAVQKFKTPGKELAAVAVDDPLYGTFKNYMLSIAGANYSTWSRYYDYNVLLIERNKVFKYQFLFPAVLSLDPGTYTDPEFRKGKIDRNEFNRSHFKVVTHLEAVCKSGPLLSFALLMGYSYSKKDCFIYNTENGHLYNCDKIIPDSLNSYLPIMRIKISAADNDYFYCAVPAYELFQAKEQTADKHPVYPMELKNYFSTHDRKSNSFIVVLKPKASL